MGQMKDTVQRWDVYDVADELADVKSALLDAIDDVRLIPEIAQKVEGLTCRLWEASTIGVAVGPFPDYHQHPSPEA